MGSPAGGAPPPRIKWEGNLTCNNPALSGVSDFRASSVAEAQMRAPINIVRNSMEYNRIVYRHFFDKWNDVMGKDKTYPLEETRKVIWKAVEIISEEISAFKSMKARKIWNEEKERAFKRERIFFKNSNKRFKIMVKRYWPYIAIPIIAVYLLANPINRGISEDCCTGISESAP
jgi:hypothetical protein